MIKLEGAISRFGADAKAKLANPGATGEPEDQLRAPLEGLFADLAELCGMKREWLAAVGESSLSTLKTRPDYAITLRNVLVGFVEIKAPGKGGDPRRYKGHDKQQWEKLQSLPNLLYTDGNSFSLWQNGELVGSIVELEGDVETSGAKLAAPQELVARFDNFLRWEPIPPKSAAELAKVSARLCRLLRDEVTEQLAEKSPALTALAADWRKLLFPEANDQQFADGYAQAVTFGLLMARSSDIKLADGLDQVAGDRREKFAALSKLKLQSKVWQDCSTDWRAADHWRPAAAVQARRNPSGPLAGRVYVRTAQRTQRPGAAGGDGTGPGQTAGGDL